MEVPFEFSCLQINLRNESRTLIIELDRPQHEQRLNLQMVQELERVLTWVASHCEVACVLLTSTTDIFCGGIDPDYARELCPIELQNFLSLTQKVVYSLLHLPQVVVVDLKLGASNLGIELASGADIRLGHPEMRLCFDHLRLGLVPSSGGLAILSSVIPIAHLRNWALQAQETSFEALKSTGFVAETHLLPNREHWIEQKLKGISELFPMARIQTKGALLAMLSEGMVRPLVLEERFSRACLVFEDWKVAMDQCSPGRTYQESLKRVQQVLQS